ERNGYRVLTAPNGAEGLRIAEEESVHRVLTDVIMPVMGGKELGDRLHSKAPNTKIVYMSGYTDDAIHHHGILDPGIVLLEKPFSDDVLLLKIRETLEGPFFAVSGGA